ncbi:hypothetical protein EYF80_004693 [Liparis tanakae]|uniref:Uncharacterized protein n=1 Tax=Liparis tanakae TaxID=230148 RepID=A0A4Z2J496_9TELE|nr:hypothetical protein EYF80_004693 [Liparis tanakae]
MKNKDAKQDQSDIKYEQREEDTEEKEISFLWETLRAQSEINDELPGKRTTTTRSELPLKVTRDHGRVVLMKEDPPPRRRKTKGGRG